MTDRDVLGEIGTEVLGGKLGALKSLLDRSGIDIEDISRVQKVNVWQGFIKNDEGEAEVVDLAGISLIPRWADGPEWPVVQRGPAVKLPPFKKAAAPKGSGWETCVVLPDIQMGYFRTASGMEPTHDENAITVALSIVRAAKPGLVVLVGDNLDLPEMGKYRLSPPFAQTTQATIDRATTFCAQVRAAAPEARIVWLAGNHEERMPNYIMDNAMACFGLRKGNEPESWPVMSVPYLCRMDEYEIEYKPGYPASEVWINERLRVIHGDKVASNASTAHKYLGVEKTSVIYGHIHRREWAERTRIDHDGPRTIMAASPGCLARIDGAVPSTKQGLDLDGRPLTRYEDWQSGLAVVQYEPGDGRFVYEQVAIRHDDQGAWAFWHGKDFRS